MAFSWLDRTDRPHAAASRGNEVAEEEVANRAGLLYRLGYTAEDATARLVARVAWEFEPTSKSGPSRRPESLSDAGIAKIVAETYARRPK